MTQDPTAVDESSPDYFAEEAATFGDRLAAARDAAGFTQRDLASRLGIMVKTLRAWEDDRSEPRANKLQMLAGMLNVSMSWLISGQGDGVAGDPEPNDMSTKDILAEMRALRAESVRLTSRLGRLEKRLRGVLQ